VFGKAGGATIAGGGYELNPNSVTADFGTVGGGYGNRAGPPAGSPLGPYPWPTVGGGNGNTASNDGSTVGGGVENTASGEISTVGGGGHNISSGDESTVGGGYGNQASGLKATIAGGGWTDNSHPETRNRATDDFGTIGGGGNNQAGNGDSDTTNAAFATVAGGGDNTASSHHSTVGGGGSNTSSGPYSAIAGGFSNAASGQYATVPGGNNNMASGDYSLAAGCGASSNNQAGAFVWADGNCWALKAVVPNQFLARATGGVEFITAIKISIVLGQGLVAVPTAGVPIAAGGMSWSNLSDRNVKEHFAPVDTQALLAQVAALPVTTWNYQSQPASIRHIGPMAQDFYAAFNVGEDDKHITEIDEGGVALAAIQGLNQKLEQELKQKEEEIQILKSRLEKLETVMAATLPRKQ